MDLDVPTIFTCIHASIFRGRSKDSNVNPHQVIHCSKQLDKINRIDKITGLYFNPF